jgi:hypothetical protein
MRHRIVLTFAAGVVSATLAACGGASKSGPAWPKSAGNMTPDTWEEDGGESIEPRVASDAAPVESGSDPLFDFLDFNLDATPPPPDTTQVEVTPAPPPDEVLPEETIIIEGDPPPPSDDGGAPP